jgi:exodeoxyribonuclease-3
MKLEAFNIRHGGGTRVNEIVKSIRRHDPDLVLLTEFRENKNGETIKSLLKEDGYSHQVSSGANPKINTVLFASKTPIISSSFFDELGPHSHRLVLIQFPEFALVGFYFPLNNEKRPVFEKLLELFEEHSQKPFIALGDLNTGKHYLDETGNTFIASEYIDALEVIGVDAWRKFHGDKKEYTWFSNYGNGFRIDHVFTTKAMSGMLQGVEYSHIEREGKVSDHSSLIVEFQVGKENKEGGFQTKSDG